MTASGAIKPRPDAEFRQGILHLWRNFFIDLAVRSKGLWQGRKMWESHTVDDVTALIAEQIEKIMPLDEKTSEQFRQLMKKMIGRAENENIWGK